MTATLPDVVTPENLGLPKDNRNFVANPRTDVSNTEYEAMGVSVAAMSHTGPRAHVYVDADAAAAAILDHDAVWGDTDGVKPTLTRSAQGVYLLEWAASYDDLNPTVSRRTSHATNIRFAHATIAENQAATTAVVCTANTATVYIYDDAGAAQDYDFVVTVY